MRRGYHKGIGGVLKATYDYVGAMTDASLLRTFERMFSPRMGFDKLSGDLRN
jgi:hypothetical protein